MKDHFDSVRWLDLMVSRILKAFGDRVLYIGNTGSYARGEATESSDIDVNVVLDSLSVEDLSSYRKLIHSMPNGEKACGFICGRKEMAAWPAQELFQFTMGCRVLYGSLEGIIKEPTDEDIRDNIRNIASAVYHETCHRFLYGSEPADEAENLRPVYKSVFYALQEWIYLRERRYVPTKRELLLHLNAEGEFILSASLRWDALKEDRRARPQVYFGALINWSGRMLQNTARNGDLPPN